MQRILKLAGGAFVIGAILMFTRMAPIFSILPDDMAFPPETTEEMVRLGMIAGYRWQLSHVMGLAAVLLFAAAYGLHAKVLINLGSRRIALIIAVCGLLAFSLFGLALTIDGFFVPDAIYSYANSSDVRPMTLEQVAAVHSTALKFFTPAVVLMFISVGLLSSPMIHRRIHTRWQGWLGQFIAVVAISAWLVGATGPNWNKLEVAGTLMMSAFAWHLLVGMRTLFSKSPFPRGSADQGTSGTGLR